ncbi:nucleotidyltransferase [Streptomyces sp. NPDC015350]|uniref:nucleotidyltransferase n=1 Tax=Streptomyces sp. NPDC015350 TaxID=3364955 RepID=UPI0036FF4F42
MDDDDNGGGGGDRGLDEDGTIRREGSLSRVPAVFAPVVAAARSRISAAFDGTRLHSAYVYGSIPRGTAMPGVSDLDLLLALHDAPTPADEAAARAVEADLDASSDRIDGVGVLLSDVGTLTGELERDDLGFFVACLCTPLLGEDLAQRLPSYRPTGRLARETNGDLHLLLPRWRRRAAEAATDAERRYLSRGVARRLVRSGFTLVMPRWGGWTSDLVESAEVFARYYADRPERVEQLRSAARVGRAPSADPAVIAMLVEDLAPWLAAEYLAVHGPKAPRP